MPGLTNAELIAAARMVAAVRSASPDAIRDYSGEDDLAASYAVAFEEAQHLLRQLADRLEQSGS